MAVTLIDEIRAAEKTAEEIREAAVDEARGGLPSARRRRWRNGSARKLGKRAKPWHSGFARGKSARRARRTPLRRGAALSGRR